MRPAYLEPDLQWEKEEEKSDKVFKSFSRFSSSSKRPSRQFDYLIWANFR